MQPVSPGFSDSIHLVINLIYRACESLKRHARKVADRQATNLIDERSGIEIPTPRILGADRRSPLDNSWHAVRTKRETIAETLVTSHFLQINEPTMDAATYNESKISTAEFQAETRRSGSSPKNDRAKALRRVQRVANLMDSRFSISGLPIRFGVDSLVGLIPGVGDAVTAAISLWMVREARRLGLPKRRIARMLANIGIDLTVGAIPVVGDVFDVFWKSNVRNARLIEKHLSDPPNQQEHFRK